MMSAAGRRVYRRLRYGRPLVIVSGLPRSGTSMMMRMLEAGGAPIWQDGVRAADDQNPHGYYELERVKSLDQSGDTRWLADGRGRALKVISMLLEHLPRTNNYRVIFMRRSLEEVLASQAKMLAGRGSNDRTADTALIGPYEAHLTRVAHLLSHDPAFAVLNVFYADVLDDPLHTAQRVRRFVGLNLDVARMVAAVDPQLYRNRRTIPAPPAHDHS
jgi:hypothetical protein